MAKLNKEQWVEVLAAVKKGDKSVPDLAKVYGISAKSIYRRVEKATDRDGSLLEINKLKREVKNLREVLGYVTAELSKEKKLF
jgi:transposase-like protein